MNMATPSAGAADAQVSLDRDVFMRSLIRDLAGTLEDVVGLDEASGIVSVVGERIDADYRQALGRGGLDRAQVVDVLVDLKRPIGGSFSVVELSDERIVFADSACPFGDKVLGRPSMCMMTSNVFGTIAAENLGRAKVVLESTIANGAPGCRVGIHLTASPEAAAAGGREYFKT